METKNNIYQRRTNAEMKKGSWRHYRNELSIFRHKKGYYMFYVKEANFKGSKTTYTTESSCYIAAINERNTLKK